MLSQALLSQLRWGIAIGSIVGLIFGIALTSFCFSIALHRPDVAIAEPNLPIDNTDSISGVD